MKQRHYQLASDFLAALANGELPDEMLTADMTAWLTTQGTVSKASYQQAVRLLDKMCERPLKYTIHSLTADEDRVIVEAQSEGTLINAKRRATPICVLCIREGRIASVAEHYNALIAQEKLLPLMKQMVTDKSV